MNYYQEQSYGLENSEYSLLGIRKRERDFSARNLQFVFVENFGETVKPKYLSEPVEQHTPEITPIIEQQPVVVNPLPMVERVVQSASLPEIQEAVRNAYDLSEAA